MRFTIDGKVFDPERVDQAVQLGTVEEWTLANASSMDRPMHLHVWPMQVVAEGGQPAMRSRGATSSTFRREAKRRCVSPSTATPGRTVYHCHILDDEDNGMMGVLTAT